MRSSYWQLPDHFQTSWVHKWLSPNRSKKVSFCIVSLPVFTDATTNVMCVTADMRLFNDVARAFLTTIGRTHIVAPLQKQLVSRDNLNMAKEPVMRITSLGMQKCALMCEFFVLCHLENFARHCFVVKSGAVSKVASTVTNAWLLCRFTDWRTNSLCFLAVTSECESSSERLFHENSEIEESRSENVGHVSWA